MDTPAARWRWWAVAAGVALLSASQWLHAPSVEYLALFVIATAVTTAAAVGIRGAQRVFAAACAAFLVLALLFALPAQRNLWRVAHNWSAWQAESTARALAALRQALDDAVAWSTRSAASALAETPQPGRTFDELAGLARGDRERGIVLYHADDAIAWSGSIWAPLDWSAPGVTITESQFYLTLQTVDGNDLNRRAAAVVLLDAVPPADRWSVALTDRVAADAGVAGFHFGRPTEDGADSDVLHYAAGGRRLFDARVVPLIQEETSARIVERVRARAGLAFIFALASFIIGVWRGTRALSRRAGVLVLALACVAVVPFNQFSNFTRLFDPSVYFTPHGGPLTANAGALAATGAIVLLGLLAALRRQSLRTSRSNAVITILIIAGLGPFLLRELARGVQVPLHGVDGALWLIWEIPLFLAAVSVLLAGATAGAIVVGARRGLAPWCAPAAAAVAGALAPVVWHAPGGWPWWYTIVWVAAIVMLALSRRTRYVILSAAVVASLGATTLVWARASRGRVDAAVRDVEGLQQIDPVAAMLLRRFAATLGARAAPATREALLQSYVGSDISAAGNPMALSAWRGDSAPSATFETAALPIPGAEVQRLVAAAHRSGTSIIAPVATRAAIVLVMATPSPDGGVTAAVLGPRSRLFPADPFASLVGLETEEDLEPAYTLRLRQRGATDTLMTEPAWRSDGSLFHADLPVRTSDGGIVAHIEVELRPLHALVERGALIVLLDLAIVGLLWLASVIADGGAGRWLEARRRSWARSYRVQLSLALFAFFVIPAAAFAIWSYEQLATAADQSRAILVSETLRALATAQPRWLQAESERLDTPLLLYRGGELRASSDTLYAELAPAGRYLPQATQLALTVRDEETDTRVTPVGAARVLFGYRSFGTTSPSTVIAAPARADELPLGRRRRDLGVLVLFATALGALGALWLSGIAARQLARPIATLREAALAIAAGGSAGPLDAEPTLEFSPVFTAFRRMETDLDASRAALEEAQRRTAAVLRNVGSGVIAVNANATIALANPRAESLLGCVLAPGTLLAACAPPAIVAAVERFLMTANDEETLELTDEHQQLRGVLTRLTRAGAVLTLDDVTELARAQRVLAWGEMARQVAHEIKNPLTPIRLGVQHLRRARGDARVDFDKVLDQNVRQILTEIDRLDEIARAFSRYGAAPEERPAPAVQDVAAVVQEVVALERMGDESVVSWEAHGADAPVFALARGNELKEVLLNLLENARHAHARTVRVRVARAQDNDDAQVSISVADDGDGIPPEALPRIFEPHFSTRTSGSGLGLAISRRLVESWGGEIGVDSSAAGTVVEIVLKAG